MGVAQARSGRPGQYLVVRTAADGRVEHHGPMLSCPPDKQSEAERRYRKSPDDVIVVSKWTRASRTKKRLAVIDSINDDRVQERI